jgi:CHASE2 domain-containing sensor protein
MKSTSKKTTQEKKLEEIVMLNLKQYKEAYVALDLYDKSPESAPVFEARRRELQKALQRIPK